MKKISQLLQWFNNIVMKIDFFVEKKQQTRKIIDFNVIVVDISLFQIVRICERVEHYK